MSLTKGQYMTQYKNTRNELGTIRYSKLVKPNILEDYSLYLKDLTEMTEIENNKEILEKVNDKKKINIQEKKTLLDLLDIKTQEKEEKKVEKEEKKKEEKKKVEKEEKKVEEEEKKVEKEEKKKEEKKKVEKEEKKVEEEEKKVEEEEEKKVEKSRLGGSNKKIKITVSTEPDNKSNKLII